MLTKFGAIRLWADPTLADELHSAGIPETCFTRAGHSEGVNASCAHHNQLAYLACMEVGVGQFMTGFPQLVRCDAKTGRVTRTELRGDDKDCCGVRLEIDFSRNYVSFHNHLSVNAILVVDHRLCVIETLFGFDFREVAPDRVVLAENIIHFAPAHQERLSLVERKEKQPCCA